MARIRFRHTEPIDTTRAQVDPSLTFGAIPVETYVQCKPHETTVLGRSTLIATRALRWLAFTMFMAGMLVGMLISRVLT